MSSQQRLIELKKIRVKKITIIRGIKDTVFISLGVLSAAFGLKGFLLPNDFLDGGVMGISLLTNVLTDIDLAYLVVILNIPFIIVGYKQISKLFALKTLIALQRSHFVFLFLNSGLSQMINY
jgi:uncharacterized membrane-anchored protein YitT (DUF2179 family)